MDTISYRSISVHSKKWNGEGLRSHGYRKKSSGEYFLNKPFGLFLVNLKATDNHFLNVLEKTQLVLGEFYEPVFCEISLVTLYIGLPGCHCS